MAQKKKNMDGGRIFNNPFRRKSPDVPISINNSNRYLNHIKNLQKIYSNIDTNKISVSNLNTKVKSLITFSQTIKNKNGLMPLLEQVKETLIQKLLKKLEKYDRIFQEDHNLYNFSELLSILQDFEKLSDQIILLGSERNNLGSLKIKKNQFIAAMLNKYEEEILYKLQGNSNSQIELLKKEVEDYISKYSQFTVEIGTKRGANNSINSIVHRLSKLFEKISRYSTNSTRRNKPNQTGLQQNSSQQFKVNNSPNKLKQSLINTQKGYINYEKIREIANKTFDLLSHKFDLAIKFLDTIGNSKRIKKGINNSLVNNAVVENKDLAKNIRILYDLWIELLNKYSTSFKNANKLEKQASIIDAKKQEYSQKIVQIQQEKYVNYI